MDNLYKNGAITSDIFSVSFEPTNEDHVENGVLTFGGIDSTQFTGDLTYA
jgi:cathepsin E